MFTFLQINLQNCKFLGPLVEYWLSKLSTNQNAQFHCDCLKALDKVYTFPILLPSLLE